MKNIKYVIITAILELIAVVAFLLFLTCVTPCSVVRIPNIVIAGVVYLLGMGIRLFTVFRIAKSDHFYNLILVKSASFSFVLGMIECLIAVLLPVPHIVFLLLCTLVTILECIFVIKYLFTIDTVKDIEVETVKKISTMSNIIAKTKILMEITTGTKHDACIKLYEAVRYSDPVTSAETELIEQDILAKVAHLLAWQNASDTDFVKEVDSIILDVKQRNVLCVSSKN